MFQGITGKAWNDDELELIVRHYLSLYLRVAAGEKVIKEHIYKAIAEELGVRSTASVALKMSNISSVMLGLGWPHIPGLGPMPHIQIALVDHVARGVLNLGGLDAAASRIVTGEPISSPVKVELAKQIPRILKFDETYKTDLSLSAKRNYIEIESRNKKLGYLGELAVLEYEDRRLRRMGLTRLANRIEHVSSTQGDGLGYDIHSFHPDGQDKLIEVKTTSGSNSVPFYVTRNELEASREYSESYCLSRIYDYPLKELGRRRVKLYELSGSIEDTCNMRPQSYLASPKSQ